MLGQQAQLSDLAAAGWGHSAVHRMRRFRPVGISRSSGVLGTACAMALRRRGGGSACGDLVRIAVTRARASTWPRRASRPRAAPRCAAAASAAVELVEGEPFLDGGAGHARRRVRRAGRARPAAPSRRRPGRRRPAPRPGRRGARRRAGARARSAADARGHERRRGQRRRRSARAGRRRRRGGRDARALGAIPPPTRERSCCSPAGRARARARWRTRMGIPHVTLDLRERFRPAVVDDFVDELRPRARRPTRACAATARCASTRWWRWPAALGAARLATGHYARIARDADGPLLRARCRPA